MLPGRVGTRSHSAHPNPFTLDPETTETTRFHPLIHQWFAERYGKPTEIQRRSWPLIAKGRHLLISAPTGSGKTLTAFLWTLDRLVSGQWPLGQTRVLYISPLKALNNDIQRNLLQPLSELRIYFERENLPFPEIRVMTRSGDTNASERARMLRHPPEILITTPESLNLLLSSIRGRAMLSTVRTVILDEIHSVAGNKRGTHLITAVDRLVLLAGEFQRIALSATVTPLGRIAEWVGGRRMENHDGQAVYIPRPVEILDSQQSKIIELSICYPERGAGSSMEPSYWSPLAEEFKKRIQSNHSTLIFTNNRQHCERLSYLLNEGQEEQIAYAHHGSLSRETRQAVEQRLKNGELAAIVATSSLELGIDIGALDEVLLLQTPVTIASALQRIGRAGHGVGQVSRGTLFPIHGRDLLDAAVIAQGVLQRDIEPIHPVACPLDILAQILVSMTGVEEWQVDELYDFLRTSAPYFELGRHEFDLVLAMLEGRYFGKYLRHIHPMISLDGMEHTVRARRGALQKVYQSGGTIPDHGHFLLRHRDTRTKIGELDEEFVWERRIGDTFNLGTQTWKIFQITHNDVFVLPTDEPIRITPFWRNETALRDYPCARKIGEFLKRANQELHLPSFHEFLRRDCHMDENAAHTLLDFLHRQKETSRSDLPHVHHLLIEKTRFPGAPSDWQQIVFHTSWGGRVNRPAALALSAVWQQEFGERLESFANNEGILLSIPAERADFDWLPSIPLSQVENLLRQSLEASGFFGARFRENAARALLLPRAKIEQRTPLWLHRLRSQELMQAVSAYDDFPILLETWRTCLWDEFDLPALREVLQQVHSGEITVSEIETTVPTPFANSLIWQQTNTLVYRGDEATAPRSSSLRRELIHSLTSEGGLRPDISPELIRDLELRLQRLLPGYAPSSAQELLDWVKERWLIPWEEWTTLCKIIQENTEAGQEEIFSVLREKLVRIGWSGASTDFAAAIENLSPLFSALQLSPKNISLRNIFDESEPSPVSLTDKRLKRVWMKQDHFDLGEFLTRWLAYYGPLPRSRIIDILGLDGVRLAEALKLLLDEQRLATGFFSQKCTEEEICDVENFERLLRWKRRASRPTIQPRPAQDLPLFLAIHQGLTRRGESRENFQTILESLLGYPASAELWEREIFPARMHRYSLSWLDELMRESGLLWYGCGKETIAFCFPDQIDALGGLLVHENGETPQEKSISHEKEISQIFPDPRGKYDYMQLCEHVAGSSEGLTEMLWRLAWQGAISADCFTIMRYGIGANFQSWKVPEAKIGRRGGFRRWINPHPFTGNWFVLNPPTPPNDSLEELERRKECVRMLLNRYGILFRELLLRELPALRWGTIFPALRLMELSGELAGGYFFEGIPGVQFISPDALTLLGEKWPEEDVFWMSAVDPASLCGSSLECFKSELPMRRSGNHLVYQGNRLAVISTRGGKELTIRIPVDDPHVSRCFEFFQDEFNRPFSALTSITLETINGQPAMYSEYLNLLREIFHLTADYKKVTLRKRFC